MSFKMADVKKVQEDVKFLDFSEKLESHTCKDACSFLNFLHCNDANDDSDNNNDSKCNNHTTRETEVVAVNCSKSLIFRSSTFSTSPKQYVTVLTPTSTRTTLLTHKKATSFVGTTPEDDPVSLTPCAPSSILSTSPETFSLLSRPSTKTELIFQGEVLLCRLGEQKTVLRRLVSSTCLRRWEKHRLVLDNSDIHSTTPFGCMDGPISYQDINEIIMLPRLQQTNKFCLQLLLGNFISLVLQTTSHLQRDQWFYSIQWRTAMVKFDGILRSLSPTSDLPVQSFKDLISVALKSGIKDSSIQHYPLQALSFLLTQHQDEAESNKDLLSSFKELAQVLSQLLDTSNLSKEMVDFYNKHKRTTCYRDVIIVLFKPLVLHLLKHNINFGKTSRQFVFVHDYIVTVGKNIGPINEFVSSVHGDMRLCPHLNVLPNLISLCLSSLHNCYQAKKRFNSASCATLCLKQEESLTTFFVLLQSMISFDDWRLDMSRLLHSVPFDDESLENKAFFKQLMPTLSAIAEDKRCEVHTTVLKVRSRSKEWLSLICPGSNSCCDEGKMYSEILDKLVGCCCKRKSFVQSHMDMLRTWKEMAQHGQNSAIELLILSLEYNLLDDGDASDVMSVLSQHGHGRRSLEQLNKRQDVLKELQKEGPLSLTLPARSTDADLSRTLSAGPFGNVESLSLAFTMVTSACAADLIKLPSLKHLNLWSTKFGDEGLEIICEHMHLLQVLNLCETPVTDKGLKYLTALKNLQKLNLNSTNLSAVTFESLKEKLPHLEEFDVCYTDAW